MNQSYRPILGLDVGEKTIGLALSDVLQSVASPLLTIKRTKFSEDVKQLADIIEKHQVMQLVIGYPLNMDGTIGPRAQSVKQFARNVEKELGMTPILWDERMSTQAVERTMLQADMSRQRRSQIVDKLAASYILQGYLDSIRNS